jgi:DNA-binding HxlR family transcriptional regulator
MGLPILSVPEENACGCVDRASSSDGHDCLCSATGLVQIIGRRYALRILFLIGERGCIRYNEIRSEMDDMSTSTLSIRLAEMEQAKLIRRQMFAEIPPRVEYTLTKDGDKLRKSLFSLSRFASRK